MKANNILFRCSSLGYLMTEPRSKSETISDTTKTHLVDVFVSNKYGRNTDIQTKYTNKGMMVEEDSITLFSRFKGEYFEKNENHFENSYIKGTPDIMLSERIVDVKSSWDIFTFFRAQEKLNKLYYWQLQGYMALTGMNKATLAYCLIDTPEILLNDEKRKLMWKMGALSEESPEYIKASEELEKLLTYPDLSVEERVFEIEVEKNEDDIERLYKRINDCREYMNERFFKNDEAVIEQPQKDYPALIQKGKELKEKVKL